MNDLVAQLQAEPALAWKITVNVKGKSSHSEEARHAALITQNASIVRTLLSEIDASGHIPHHPYKKWNGGHWVLSLLADLGFPPGDERLRLLMDDIFHWLLSPEHARNIRMIAGRTRRCASQEGNAAWSSLRLGLADSRTDELVNRLLVWQWPDGGWNCDKHPEADSSSFMESLIPLRALAEFATVTGDTRVRSAADHAVEIFLKRKLFRRIRDGSLMDPHFVLLSYPSYWHYNILFGLKVIAEAGFVTDNSCKEALDLLESKRLPDGGFPAEETYSRTTRPSLSGYSLVSWGGTSKGKMNPFVTADALYVLKMAGRM